MDNQGMLSTIKSRQRDFWQTDRLWAQGQRGRACWCLRWAGSAVRFSDGWFIHANVRSKHTRKWRKSKKVLDTEERGLECAAVSHQMKAPFHCKGVCHGSRKVNFQFLKWLWICTSNVSGVLLKARKSKIPSCSFTSWNADACTCYFQ